jgi:sugar transferase (PEP-CTERM/EpsH1 system associated)
LPFTEVALAKRGRMTDRPALVCHLIYRLSVGGLENGLVNLINRLPEDGCAHAIICITGADNFRKRIRRQGVDVYEIHKRPGKDVAAYGRAWRILRRLRPRVVHTRNLPALDMLFAAKLSGVPRLVHSEHGLDKLEIDGKNRRYNALRRLSRVVVDKYITVSRDLGTWLRREIGVPEDRLETIYNGVDLARFAPDGPGRSILPESFRSDGTIVVGTLGRMDWVKNQVMLAQAFVRALERRPLLRGRLRLAIVGDGQDRTEIEALLGDAGVRDLAWLPGFREDTPSVYRALDIFVLPSLREGISNTLLEAMASGRPVIATEVGGNVEIVPDGIAGRLVPLERDAVAAALLDYVDNPALMLAHGQGGRTHVSRSFSLETMVNSYDRIYRSLL